MGSSDIEKLSDTTHFPDWAMQMEALLEEKELWDVVTGDEPLPTSDCPSPRQEGGDKANFVGHDSDIDSVASY